MASKQVRRRWGCVRVLLVAAAVCTALAVVAGWWALENVLPYAIVCTNHSERWERYRDVSPGKLGLRADAFECEVEPGIRLKGWFVHTEGTPRGTIFLLHGHNSCKEAMLGLAKTLAAEGFNSLAYDSRGCGESGGRFCTFGFYEHRDCSRCLDTLLGKYGGSLEPAAIYGVSFGGAVALQTMAADPRFRCAVVKSTFATLREIVRDYEQHITGCRLDWIVDHALYRAGQLAHFPPELVRPEDAARRIQRPVLLIHGTADEDISVRYGERIFRNLDNAPGSEWLPIQGAGHGNLGQTGGDEYWRHILDFLRRNDA